MTGLFDLLIERIKLRFAPNSGIPKGLRRVEESERERYFRRTFVHSTHLVLAEDLKSIHIMGALLLSLFLGAFTFTVAVFAQFKDKDFFLLWLVVALGQFLMIPGMARARTYHSVCARSLFVAIGALAWWLLLELFSVGPEVARTLLVSITLLGGMALPRPKYYQGSLFVLFLGLTFVLGALVQDVRILVPLALFMLISGSLIGARIYIGVLSRTLAFLIAKSAESHPPALALIRALAWQFSLVFDSQAALIIYDGSECEGILYGSPVNYSVPGRVLRALAVRVEESQRSEGLLITRSLDPQLKPLLREWFHREPKALSYVALEAIIGQREQQITILCPASVSTRLSGSMNILRVLVGLASVARIAFVNDRIRFFSSGAVNTTQRNANDREVELNRVVHLVNNVSQDIAIRCERLLESNHDRKNSNSSTEDFYPTLQRIESEVKILAARVTDVKLSKELLLTKPSPHREDVPLSVFLKDITVYLKDFAEQRGVRFSVTSAILPEWCIRIGNRDFLETAFRSFIFGILRRAGKGTEVTLTVRMHGEKLFFEVVDQGPSLPSEFISKLVQSDALGAQDEDLLLLRSVRHFAFINDGAFDCSFDEKLGGNVFELALPGVNEEQDLKNGKGHWVLLVDDNPEITNFYGRIAHALELDSEEAVSVDSAWEIVERRGRPRLVISDVCLLESTGVELVGKLRDRFGATLPIIVVTGEAEEDVKDELRREGASKVLHKPVGRARLFNVIREYL